jgi:mobilization protein NikA
MLPLEPMTGGGPGPEPEVSAMTDTTGKSTTDKWAARTNAFQFEVTANEHAFLTAKAAEQGLTLEEYIRTCCGFPS